MILSDLNDLGNGSRQAFFRARNPQISRSISITGQILAASKAVDAARISTEFGGSFDPLPQSNFTPCYSHALGGFMLRPTAAPILAPTATPRGPPASPSKPPRIPPAVAFSDLIFCFFSRESGARVFWFQVRAVRVERLLLSRLHDTHAGKRLFR